MLKKLALAIVLTAGVSTAYARVFEIRTYTTSQKMERLEAFFRERDFSSGEECTNSGCGGR